MAQLVTTTIYGDLIVQRDIYLSGNVGIGTTNPAYKLDVAGDIRFTGTLQGGTVPWARLSGVPAASTSQAGIVQLNNTVTSTSTTQAATANAVKTAYDTAAARVAKSGDTMTGNLMFSGGTRYIGTSDSNNFVIRTANTDRITIASNGNVGIGTSSPDQKLDVAGNIRTSGQLISTVATGTAPLAVSSTTRVTNLNADMVDGYHISDLDQRYASANHGHFLGQNAIGPSAAITSYPQGISTMQVSNVSGWPNTYGTVITFRNGTGSIGAQFFFYWTHPHSAVSDGIYYRTHCEHQWSAWAQLWQEGKTLNLDRHPSSRLVLPVGPDQWATS